MHSIAVACFFLAFHFLLLEQWTGTVLMIVSGVRYVASGYTTDRRWMYFFCITAILGTVWTYAGLVSLLSFSATFVLTIAAFSRTDKRLRELTFVGTVFWVAHNIVVWSPSAIALESFFLMSNIVGYYRYYICAAKQDTVLESE